MSDNLPELRDIHLPDEVSWFPPAVGWYALVLLVILCFVVFVLVKKIIKYSRASFAKNLIENVDISNPVLFAVSCSEMLRRICVYKYKEAMSLKGKEWEAFLASHCAYKLDEETLNLLSQAPYINPEKHTYSIKQAEDIKAFCYKFIGENL